jgi:hypothetical protein
MELETRYGPVIAQAILDKVPDIQIEQTLRVVSNDNTPIANTNHILFGN